MLAVLLNKGYLGAMSGDGDNDSEHTPARVPPKNPARQSSHRPLRPRDSMGALRPSQAELDAAEARGYADGLEEGREDALDQLRTILVKILEKKFGQLEDRAMDCIAEAEDTTLERWIIAAPTARTLEDVFAA